MKFILNDFVLAILMLILLLNQTMGTWQETFAIIGFVISVVVFIMGIREKLK